MSAASTIPTAGPQAPAVAVSALIADVRLREGMPSGVVHSVFDAVVNIAPAEGDLWCLAARRVPAGPRTVVVDIDGFDLGTLTPGDRVTVDAEGVVHVGDALHVATATATSWDCPRVGVLGVRADRLRELEQALAVHGVPGGAYAGADLFGRAVAARIDEGLTAIATAVAASDATALARQAQRLVGLGVGLTPAGDDVLTGLAFAAAQLGGRLALIPAAVTAAAVRGRTHDISLVALHEASRGRATAPLAAVLCALCGDDDADIPALTAALCAIGHTSGTDQARGLIAAARLARTP